MLPKDPNDCVVTVTIELGHTANFLKEPSLEGFTHDWTVFVRGKDGSKIEHFVEKVVFKLHKTFKCPTRAKTEPPYKVSESGYAGFLLPIEIHFKNKQVPKKIFFSYDLFLNAKDHPPINNSRYEKLKFSNPTPEFKAKLIKAGGVEQGLNFEPLPYAISPPAKTEKKKFGKRSKDGSQEKKKKKKHKPTKEASPAPSLSSLSSLSSSEDDDEIKGKSSSYHPPSLHKKEKEPAKKEPLSSSQSKSETVSSSSLSKKLKHKEGTQSTPSKDRPEKEPEPKKHKLKDRDREKEKHVSSHKSDKEKKIKSASSHAPKLSKEGQEVGYDQESPPPMNKSSSSSSSEKKSASGSHHSDNRDKNSTSSSKENSSSHHYKEKHNSHKSKESSSSSSKVKHSSSHKDLHEATPLKKHEHSEKKSKEKEKHDKKGHKRSAEGLPVEEGTERKKMKSSSLSIDDDKSAKLKTSQSKIKDVDMKHTQKDVKVKESPPKEKDKEPVVVKKEKADIPSPGVKKDKADHSSSSKKRKMDKEKEKHADKHKHGREKHRDQDGSSKHKEVKKEEKPVKSAALLETEHLAMTADFQPRLLISPLERDPDSASASDDSSSEMKPKPEQKPEMKRTFSNSSVSSVHKAKTNLIKQENQIVSGLTDSDSDSEDKEVSVYVKENSPEREADAELIKTKHRKAAVSSESIKKSKHGDGKVRKVSTNAKPGKESVAEDMSDEEEDEDCFIKADAAESDGEEKRLSDKKGLDILAPNGISLRELIKLNEKIERASENTKVLEKLVYLVGETDEFDLDETSFYFDICSLDKGVVKQIQTLLKAH